MTVTVDFAAPPDVVFGHLSDPERRPDWQSSLRRIEDLRGDGGVGTTWTDVTAVGRARMAITEVDPGRVWAERGTWRGIVVNLRLDFAPSDTGTRVTATFDLATVPLLWPAVWVLRRLAPYAVRADLQRAAHALGS